MQKKKKKQKNKGGGALVKDISGKLRKGHKKSENYFCSFILTWKN